MKKRCYPVLLHSGRLVARTPAFQVGEAGSKPVRSTKLCRGGRLVMQRIVYPSYAGSIPVHGASIKWKARATK